VVRGRAIVLWAGLLAAGVALERQRSTGAAWRLFLASVIYLPVLLALICSTGLEVRA
jgi:heme O synthase-like polyprenyltransferase